MQKKITKIMKREQLIYNIFSIASYSPTMLFLLVFLICSSRQQLLKLNVHLL